MGVDAVMQFTAPKDISDADLNELSYRLGDAVGSQHFFCNENRLAISREDGRYEVNLWGRYYGPGYERGDVWVYIAVAEWLERNVPGVTVYYGGDSDDGPCPFASHERDELIGHWAKNGRLPYIGGWDIGSDDIPAPKNCGLCAHAPMRNGWGKDFGKWHCPGCGKSWETRDGGKTYAAPSRD